MNLFPRPSAGIMFVQWQGITLFRCKCNDAPGLSFLSLSQLLLSRWVMMMMISCTRGPAWPDPGGRV